MFKHKSFLVGQGVEFCFKYAENLDLRDFPSLGQYNYVGLAPGQQNLSPAVVL